MSAAEALVAELSKSAAGGGKGIDGGDGQGQQQQQQQADALRSYALRRLVRGLASPRGAARQGFATALSAVLLASSEGGDKGVAVALKVLDTIDAELPSSSAAASGAAEHGPSSSNNAKGPSSSMGTAKSTARYVLRVQRGQSAGSNGMPFQSSLHP